MNVPEPPDIKSYTAYNVIRDDEVVLTTTSKQDAQKFALTIAGRVEEIQTTEPELSEEVTQ